jgi:hypothetical protein
MKIMVPKIFIGRQAESFLAKAYEYPYKNCGNVL